MTCAQALLLAGDGAAHSRIATTLASSRPTVLHGRARFLAEGLDAVGAVRPGRGRQPEVTAPQGQALVPAPWPETPPGTTPSSWRSRAQAAGVRRSSVQRSWDAHGLPPRSATGKLAQDPAFVEQLTAGVGLDRNPPDQAVVLGGDDKSRRQALDRPQPGLPRQPGRCGTKTHDSQRHGTTTLCAAWNVLTGEVLGQCHGRHRP